MILLLKAPCLNSDYLSSMFTVRVKTNSNVDNVQIYKKNVAVFTKTFEKQKMT